MKRAVFLDRDGVINDVILENGKPESPRSVEDFVIRAEVPGAVAKLRAAGLSVFVVTNQPDVARGLLSAAELDAMMRVLHARLPLDDARVCLHDDADMCECRKPRPGMLRDLAAAWQIDLAASFIVGDTAKDVGAGRAAGCRTVLLSREYNSGVAADYHVADLGEAAELILREVRG